ncbi:hypothetical protein [uncultured Sphingomonas sp.]
MTGRVGTDGTRRLVERALARLRDEGRRARGGASIGRVGGGGGVR